MFSELCLVVFTMRFTCVVVNAWLMTALIAGMVAHAMAGGDHSRPLREPHLLHGFQVSGF